MNYFCYFTCGIKIPAVIGSVIFYFKYKSNENYKKILQRSKKTGLDVEFFKKLPALSSHIEISHVLCENSKKNSRHTERKFKIGS